MLANFYAKKMAASRQKELGQDVLADDKKLVAPAEDFQYAVKLLKK